MENLSSYFCRMQEKQWIVEQKAEQQAIASLQQQININPVLANILIQRGIDSFERAKKYFRPSIDDLHDPFLMKDMDVAVSRIIKALSNNEKILVYGDYDVDGSTSVAMMYSFLSDLTSSLGYYIPDRYKEGYGISYQGIDFAEKEGYTLIIALDCGIKANEKIAYAQERGIDFIICDHHTPGELIPSAVAVLDPKRADCKYPYKELSGCGVGFKLIQAYCLKTNIAEHLAFQYLDLVAISIAADIVSLTGENRILAFYGLERINFNPRAGIKALLKSAALNDKIVISNLVFQVGPRINAAGRIDHAHLAVKLLTAEDEEIAEEIAHQVSSKNSTRKAVDEQITAEALAMIHASQEEIKVTSTVLYQKDWHKGVIGIVASRCIEHVYRPTIILTESKGAATGSARSVEGFDLYSAIEQCSDLLTQFGGHKHAAGLTMPIENIPAFQSRFDQIVQKSIKQEDLIPKVRIDSYLHLDLITEKFYSVLSQMDPFGPDNMQPVFAATDLMMVGKPQLLKDKHLKIRVRQNESQSIFTAIGFGLGHYYERIRSGAPFEIAFTIQENHYNNQRSLQLYLKDIRILE